MLTSKTNFASSNGGAMGSSFDDFGSIGIAAMATAWFALFLFALMSAGCAPMADPSGVDKSAVTVSSAATTSTVPVAAPALPVSPASPASPDESAPASGNVVDMTY